MDTQTDQLYSFPLKSKEYDCPIKKINKSHAYVQGDEIKAACAVLILTFPSFQIFDLTDLLSCNDIFLCKSFHFCFV